jgi:hypothetical protein
MIKVDFYLRVVQPGNPVKLFEASGENLDALILDMKLRARDEVIAYASSPGYTQYEVTSDFEYCNTELSIKFQDYMFVD